MQMNIEKGGEQRGDHFQYLSFSIIIQTYGHHVRSLVTLETIT